MACRRFKFVQYLPHQAAGACGMRHNESSAASNHGTACRLPAAAAAKRLQWVQRFQHPSARFLPREIHLPPAGLRAASIYRFQRPMMSDAFT